MGLYKILEQTQEEVNTIANNVNLYYLSFPIRKSNGKLRWLDAPQEPLKHMQVNILKEILYKFKPHPAAIGFCVGKSVKTGAEQHLGNKTVLCMDISNFFPSIENNDVARVFAYLLSKLDKKIPGMFDPATKQFDLNILTKLTTYNGSLPQGAPTSPAIANIFCLNLDKILTEWSKKNNLIYTRYADDLTFSHKDKHFDIAMLIPEVTKIIQDYGFTVNKNKTRILRPHRRMQITGVVINDKLGVAKYKWRNLRAFLHNVEKSGQSLTLDEYRTTRGQIEWIRQLNHTRGEQLLQALGKVTLVTS
jgi:retron-type reverse transcriptase